MKIYVNGQLIDTNHTMVVMVFDNDAEKEVVVKHLQNMPEKPGKRVYAIYPDYIGYNEVSNTIIEALCAS